MMAVPAPMDEAKGCLVVVVGPSGVGKDSVINAVRGGLDGRPDVLFARRTITRPAAAGGEDHEAVDEVVFRHLIEKRAFAVHWQAHGLSYGIPMAVRDHVEAGGLAIVNGSRHALPAIESAFGRIQIVGVTAEPAIIARRLAARGRESVEAIEARLRRPASGTVRRPVTVIDNSGDLAAAAEHLRALILRLAPVSDAGEASRRERPNE